MNNKEITKQLEQNGHRVLIRHYRRMYIGYKNSKATSGGVNLWTSAVDTNKIGGIYIYAKGVHDKYNQRELELRGYTINPKGGMTHASLVDAAGNIVCEATAVCCADDIFNRKMGCKVALGRLHRSYIDNTQV